MVFVILISILSRYYVLNALRLRAQVQLFATLQLLLTVILSCISVRSLSGFLSVVPTSLQWQFIPAHHIIETIKSLIDFKCPDLLCVDGEVFRVALSSPHTTATGHHHQLVLLNWNLLRGLGERRSRLVLGIVRYTLTLQSLLVFLY